MSVQAKQQIPISPALQRALLTQLYRDEFEAFNKRAFEALEGNSLEPNWHHSAIANTLEQVASGKIKRLLITMPPRSLKSHMVSVAFPAWLHGRDPKRKILCTSYGDELAVNFANSWRKLLQEKWYKSAFPNTRVSAKKNREGETLLTSGGHRLSVPAGGALTGRGADLIIIDDPIKAADAHSEPTRRRINDWFGQTVISRLNDKRTGAIVVVMQRLHFDDLAGNLIETDGWHHLDLPAIGRCNTQVPLTRGRTYDWPEAEPLQSDREPMSVLDEIKAAMGSRDFNAQYLQTPLNAEGDLINLKYFRRLDKDQIENGSGKLVLSIDSANTGNKNSDYSVIQVWRKHKYQYDLINQVRGQWDYPRLKREVETLSTNLGKPRTLVEETGIGYALIKELGNNGHNPIAVKPTSSKTERLMQAMPAIESERVGIPTEATWLGALEHELTTFPASKNDDQVDALTQFINWADKQKPEYTGLRISVVRKEESWTSGDYF